MAFTTKTRVPGIALVVAQDGDEILAFDTLSVDIEAKFATPTAANSAYIQKVITQKDGKGSLSGFLGAEFPVTLSVGDEFILTVVEGTSDVSKALKDAQAIPGTCRITHISDKVMADPGTSQIDFEWGFID